MRVLLGDELLRAWTVAASLSQMGFQTLLLALPMLAFARYDQDPRVAGLLIGAWGGGALLGSLVALRLPSRLPPLTVGSLAGFGQALPLWLLAVAAPALERLGITPVLAGVASVATAAAGWFAVVAMRPRHRACRSWRSAGSWS